MKYLLSLWIKIRIYFTIVKVVEVEKEVEVIKYEYGISHDLVNDLKKRFPRRMFIQGMNLEDFAENAGQYHIILHLEKKLRDAEKRNKDITKEL